MDGDPPSTQSRIDKPKKLPLILCLIFIPLVAYSLHQLYFKPAVIEYYDESKLAALQMYQTYDRNSDGSIDFKFVKFRSLPYYFRKVKFDIKYQKYH